MPESPFRKRNKLFDVCLSRPDLFSVDRPSNRIRSAAASPVPFRTQLSPPPPPQQPKESLPAPQPKETTQLKPSDAASIEVGDPRLDDIRSSLEFYMGGGNSNLNKQLRKILELCVADDCPDGMPAILKLAVDSVQCEEPPNALSCELVSQAVQAGAQHFGSDLKLSALLTEAEANFVTATKMKEVRAQVTEQLNELRRSTKAMSTCEQLEGDSVLTQLGALCAASPASGGCTLGVDLVNFVMEYIAGVLIWSPPEPLRAQCQKLADQLKQSEWYHIIPKTRRKAVAECVKLTRSKPKSVVHTQAALELSEKQLLAIRLAGETLLEAVDRGSGWLPEHAELMKRMTSMSQKLISGCKFALYGSAASGFGLKGSDLDVCLVAPHLEPPDEHEKEIKTTLRRLSNMFSKIGLHRKELILHAKVPIVKLEGAFSKVPVAMDICINNLLAVHNTELLRQYSEFDPRVRPVVLMVKSWAKTNGPHTISPT
eukprot:TRINITY_DN16973_c0_g1_i1.p1 TRINITY_DN16973_c0_g1~~TRINITY_DN16973_c0_g1_i1.p1  ORF type:complete len:485 (-),score=109.08 TRINITY_DN16973_c0_g1_i1:661-2115(-)